MWNRDLKFKLTLIGVTGTMAFVLMVVFGLRFDWASAGSGVGAIALLLPFASVFAARRIDPFANLLTGFMCMVGFNMCLAVLTYAITCTGTPLADDWLQRCDAAMGIHLPSIVEWARQRPWMQTFNCVYNSVLPSTLLALVVLGFDQDVRRLRNFVSHFIIGGLVTTLIYAFVPALAPTAAFGYDATPAQSRFVEHFLALREGQFPLISLSNLEGLITFPSFHTTWALLIAWSFRPYRWLFLPMLILNIGVAVSTVTTGWHYGTDVLGGILVAAVAVATTEWLGDWLHVDVTRSEKPDECLQPADA